MGAVQESQTTSDCVVNRCLIDSATNQRISCSAPSAYMAELRDEPGFPMQAVLSSHLIPEAASLCVV
jgi:hypothetical protein